MNKNIPSLQLPNLPPQKIDRHKRFGGFMLWDASFDQNNVVDGKMFSEQVKEVVEETYVAPPPGKYLF